MKFGPIPIEEAAGKLLGHNLAGPDGRRLFRKGKPITAEDIQKLRQLGRKSVYAAEIEPGDVLEDPAALRLAEAVSGSGMRLSRAAGGRVNLFAEVKGVLRVDIGALSSFNSFPGVTLATLPAHSVVRPNEIVATLKIIPYALPDSLISQVEAAIASPQPLLSVSELLPRRVGMILFGSPPTRLRLQADFEPPLRERIQALGSTAHLTSLITLEDEADEHELGELILQAASTKYDLLILAGETAIQDRYDLAPRAIEGAGGFVECVGVPVDPGNLLMLAYLDGMPILGAPGCARSLKPNAIDWILPRLLVGEHLTQADLAELGHGGLLEDTGKRPMPRSRLA